MHPIRRAASALAVAALAVAGLAGCSGSGAGGCSAEVPSGTGSESVTATGAFETAPTVSFPSPLHVGQTQATTLIAGHGDPIRRGQEVVADLTLLDGTTGRVVTKSTYGALSGAASFVVGSSVLPGLQKAFVCAQVGERIAVTIPPSQGLAASQRSQFGLGAADTLVAVADIRRAYLAKANGTPQVMAGGLPAVVLAPSGEPGITVPQEPLPTTLRIANLRKGSGAVLRNGDTAILNYTGYIWDADGTASVFDSTWDKGAPAAFTVKRASDLTGFYDAIVGQRVGSQVIAVLPPKDGYGKQGSAADAVPGNATLVFVIDVLGRN